MDAPVPGPAKQDLEESPPRASRPTLPLTPPWPPLQAVPAPTVAPAEGSVAKAPSPTSRRAGSHQLPGVAKAATVASAADRAAGPVAASGPPPPVSAPGHELDTAAAKQIETLRKGITKALQGARELLALLDSRSPR